MISIMVRVTVRDNGRVKGESCGLGLRVKG
jgi:hypothetical protein